MDERERAPDGPRRRDSKYTTNGWKEQRQYDSYRPNSSSYARDTPLVPPIRRPTQSEYWDQRLSPVARTSHDGIPSPKSQRDMSVIKGNGQTSSPDPSDVGVAVREPSLVTAGSRPSTRERNERHPLEGIGKGRGLGSEDTAAEAVNKNTVLQRRRSESSKLRLQTAIDDTVKHSDANGYMAPMSASPRRMRREDRDLAGMSLPAIITPQSARMELDISDKDTIRSGEQTPSAQTPTTFAVPALQISASTVLERASDAISQKMLVKHLFDFSQSVTESASLTMRRDTAKATMKKKEKEYEKWRSQHGDYTSLAEEQDREVEKLKGTIERLDAKLKKLDQTRDEALNVMARTMLSASNGVQISGDSLENAKTRHLETEIKSIKAQLSALKMSNGNVKDHKARLKPSEASSDEMDRGMPNKHLSLTSDTGTLKPQLVRSSLQVDQKESRDVEIENGIDRCGVSQAANAKSGALEEKIANIRREVEPLHTLRSEFDEVKTRVGVMSSSLQALSKRDSEVQQAGQYQEQETRIAELQDQALKMKNELRFLVENLAAQQDRLTSLALAQSKLSQDVKLPLSVVEQRLAETSQDLARFKKEQLSKDDLVSREAERLDQSIAIMQNRLSAMRTAVDTVTELAQSQSRDSLTLSKPATNDINFLPPVDGLSQNNQVPLTKVQESHHDHTELLADYNGRLIVCEAVLKSLQHRFDNLNTADLARNMAHQMANMYPYPANVLGQLDQMSRNYSLLAPALSRLETTVASVMRRLEKTPVSVPQSPAATTSSIAPPEKNDKSEKSIIAFQTQLSALSKEVTENSQELKDISSSIDVAKRQYQTTVEALKSEIATLKETMKTETASIKDIATERVNEERGKLAKVFADVKILVDDLKSEAVNEKLKVTEKEKEILQELASLNGKIAFVKTRFDLADQELRRAGILREKSDADDTNDRHVSTDKSASPTITVATQGNGGSEEEDEEDGDEIRQPSLGRSILSKRKRGLQRPRKHSSDSDSDFQPRRKVRTVG